jgi:polar amino acid transport system permease protein
MTWQDLKSYAPDLLIGTYYTVLLTFAGMALALVLGLILALMRLDRKKIVLAWPAQLVVDLIRSTPLLLQLFYIYYVFPLFGLKLDPIPAGILGLGINYAAYISEVYRAGIEAVDRGQWEAAEALGMSYRLSMSRIVLPQAFRIILPPLGNYFVSLFKDTALVSTISITELVFTARLLSSETFQYFGIFTTVFVIYFVISYPAGLGVQWLERRLRLAA